jgi:uncharacterized membrane protein YsdA (DUF1294 family)
MRLTEHLVIALACFLTRNHLFEILFMGSYIAVVEAKWKTKKPAFKYTTVLFVVRFPYIGFHNKKTSVYYTALHIQE